MRTWEYKGFVERPGGMPRLSHEEKAQRAATALEEARKFDQWSRAHKVPLLSRAAISEVIPKEVEAGTPQVAAYAPQLRAYGEMAERSMLEDLPRDPEADAALARQMLGTVHLNELGHAGLMSEIVQVPTFPQGHSDN